MTQKKTLADFFEDIEDDREEGRNFRHPLVNVLITAVVAVACGQKTFTAMADFVQLQVSWFGRFLDVSKGTPSQFTYRRVFEALDPEVFERIFLSWVATVAVLEPDETVAIDGKTIRNSGKKGERPIHLVSAWAAANGMVLGQVSTAEKSNEITAIPQLLEALALSGCIVTIDAMGCQTEIAKTIVGKGANYLLAVKDNQPTLHREVREYFEAYRAQKMPDERMKFFEESDKGHGRIETRRCWTTPDVEWFESADDWACLGSFCAIESERTENGKTSTETRYYISSLPGDDAQKILKASRAHWGIENRLHWCLDVTFGEDKAGVRLRNLAENFSVIRRLALNALRKIPSFAGNLAQAARGAAFSSDIRDTLMNSIS